MIHAQTVRQSSGCIDAWTPFGSMAEKSSTQDSRGEIMRNSKSSTLSLRPRSLFMVSLFMVSLILTLLCPAFVSSTPLSSSALEAAESKDEFSALKVGDRVRVVLRRGGRYEGEVVEKSGESISIKHKFGTAKVTRQECLEWERFKTIPEQYEERSESCKTANDWCDLGDWALEQGEVDLSKQAFRKATEVQSNNSRARKALGEIEYEGKWMPLEEAMKAQGKELYGGEWLTAEEIAQREEDDSAAQRAESLKGRDAYIEELRGRAWAEVEPLVTPHYVVFCNSTEENAQYYADVMESLYKAYDKVFIEKFWPRKFRKSPRSEVFIHANHQQFMDWTGNGPGIGGFYNLLRQDVTGYHGSFGSTGSTEEVLAHEGTHQFEGMIFRSLRYLPIWFVEGLAVYFGDGSKISRRKVEINQIPRDRLVGLQQAIEDGSYCDLKKLLRVPQQRFGGFFYGHAWGILYWCIYGNQAPVKAWTTKENTGGKILEDWLYHVQDMDSNCDYEKEALFFEELITRHTGQTIEEWEEEYKAWILKLPVEEIGRKRGREFSSEAIKIETTKPAGWRWEKSGGLFSDEVVASLSTGSKKRRVSTYAWPNWQHAELNEEYARSLIGNIFRDTEYIEVLAEKQMGGNPMMVAVFDGKRVLGVGENNTPELGEIRRYAVGFFGSPDKIYGNVFECDAADWDEARKYFEEYTAKFKYTG